MENKGMALGPKGDWGAAIFTTGGCGTDIYNDIWPQELFAHHNSDIWGC